jgi:hypothetical protein
MKLNITKVCGEESEGETCKFYNLTPSLLTTLGNEEKVEFATFKTAGQGTTKSFEALIIQNYMQRFSSIY